MDSDRLSPANRKIAYFSIGMAFISWMAVKLPMPALPGLADYFHTSSQVFKISVTLNLIGFSVSQIVWGPLSDRYGRKAILIYSYVLAIIGTVFAMLATNVGVYLIGRLIEGFAVGSAAPVGRAMMADQLSKNTLAKVYAHYAIAALLPPAIGPIIGGYLLVYFGWRSIFCFFLLLAAGYLFAVCMYFDNTNTPNENHNVFSHAKKSIIVIASSSFFWRYVLTYALINGFMVTYYAAMPYWYVVHFNMAEQDYAWLAFIPIFAYILGSMLTTKLLVYLSMDRLLLIGMVLAVLTSISMLCIAYWVVPSVVLINVFMSILSVASGIVTPMTNASLMHQFRDQVTVLSASMSGLRVGGAGLLVLITTNLSLDTFWQLGWYCFILTNAGLLLNMYFSRCVTR